MGRRGPGAAAGRRAALDRYAGWAARLRQGDSRVPGQMAGGSRAGRGQRPALRYAPVEGHRPRLCQRLAPAPAAAGKRRCILAVDTARAAGDQRPSWLQLHFCRYRTGGPATRTGRLVPGPASPLRSLLAVVGADRPGVPGGAIAACRSVAGGADQRFRLDWFQSRVVPAG